MGGNLWAIERSVNKIARGLRMRPHHLSREGVCGDDLVAIMPSAAHDDYCRRIRLIGSDLSKGKHLVSRKVAIFTEMFMELNSVDMEAPLHTLIGAAGWTASTLQPVRMLDVMPLKALVHP